VVLSTITRSTPRTGVPPPGSIVASGCVSPFFRTPKPLRNATANEGMVEAIAVASGKGGGRKTTATLALGMALADDGYDVTVVDADTGLANLLFHTGLRRRHRHAHDLLLGDGDVTVADATYDRFRALRRPAAPTSATSRPRTPNGSRGRRRGTRRGRGRPPARLPWRPSARSRRSSPSSSRTASSSSSSRRSPRSATA